MERKSFLTVLLMAVILIGCSMGDNGVGYLKDTILKYENADLQQNLSHFNDGSEVTLKKVVFTNDEPPYYGYIISTWRVRENPQEETVRIPIYGVEKKGWNNKTVCWFTDWETAHQYATKKSKNTAN